MTKTVIAIENDIKEWLDNRAAQEGVPMTEIVRRALRQFQAQERDQFDSILQKTSGIWQNGDGLAYQEKIREEWR